MVKKTSWDLKKFWFKSYLDHRQASLSLLSAFWGSKAALLPGTVVRITQIMHTNINKKMYHIKQFQSDRFLHSPNFASQKDIIEFQLLVFMNLLDIF